MKPVRALLILSLTWLTACAPARSELALLSHVCPTPIAYDKAFQYQLAEEFEGMGEAEAIWRAMLDYGQLRAALRAC